MSPSRIADEPARRASASSAPNSRGPRSLLPRISAQLASPLSVLVVVPSLVLIVGVVLSAFADRALRASNLEVARARLHDQAASVARSVRVSLRQSDRMLDHLARLTAHHGPDQPYADFAVALADLMEGRPGVAYVSVSFPDGTFQGAYLNDYGSLAFQDSRVTSAGTRVLRYSVSPRGELVESGQERTTYDPRQRGFYQEAVRAKASVWTKPYPFFLSRVTGITRARPLYAESAAGQGALRAVITVDYDVNALSSLLAKRATPGTRAVLYAGDGTVLALASERAVEMPKEERTLHFRDLNDPVLRALYARGPRSPSESLVLADEAFLSVTEKVSSDPALDWWVSYVAPERAFLGELQRYERQSWWTSGSVLLVAFLVAWLFALHVTRTRREVEAAKAAAKSARDVVRELGSYRLVRCLGRGGMGEVWRAEHRLLAREAAIKLIRPQEGLAVSEELTARFRREAEALSQLRSRNTIELFDYGVAADGTFFFVMELLDGMDLETLVQRHGPQPAARVIPLLTQVCASLAEAHDVGLVHRDIKPANIFICRAADELDVVKVLDFGLVRSIGRAPLDDLGAGVDLVHGAGLSAGDLTSSGGALGTPGYMAPEQTLGQELDGRADLYALGCVAVWLLTGRPLFEHENPYQRLMATLTEEPPDLAARIPEGAPAELLALIQSCLERRREARPESARALGKALRAIAFDASRWNADKAERFWSEHVPRRASLTPPPAGSPARTLQVVAERGEA